MRLVIGIVIAGLVAAAAAQPQYEVVDLTKMFGEEFTAVDINNNGVVVGHMRLNASQDQACTIQNGKLTMLPMYQGIHPWYATDINDKGDVLGAGTLGTGTYHTILYRNGKVIDTGIQGSQSFPGATSMNNLAQIAGGANGMPFIWHDGKMTPIPGAGSPHAINDSQTLVGRVTVVPELEARMWSGGVYSSLHPAWARRSESVNVNEFDESAGYAYRLTGGQRGVLWREGEAIDLGDFGGGQSRAYDVNDLSQVVGWGADPGGIIRAFLWEKQTMHNLEDLIPGGSGFQIIEIADSINNQSQILASGFTGNAGHEILLNPVPEPSSLLAILTGVLALTNSRRRGRRG